MHRRLKTTLLAVLFALFAATATTGAAPLTPKQQKVLDYLVANWGVDTAVTGIDLAMQIVGGKYTVEDRYALAAAERQKLRAGAGAARIVSGSDTTNLGLLLALMV